MHALEAESVLDMRGLQSDPQREEALLTIDLYFTCDRTVLLDWMQRHRKDRVYQHNLIDWYPIHPFRKWSMLSTSVFTISIQGNLIRWPCLSRFALLGESVTTSPSNKGSQPALYATYQVTHMEGKWYARSNWHRSIQAWEIKDTMSLDFYIVAEHGNHWEKAIGWKAFVTSQSPVTRVSENESKFRICWWWCSWMVPTQWRIKINI